MKIAFLDFEFGQIYGSWRRDFLITEAAILIYDTATDEIKLAEKIFMPLSPLVMRKRVKLKNKEIIKREFIVDKDDQPKLEYDKEYRIQKSTAKKYRIKWNKVYTNILRSFFRKTISNVDLITLFGGYEDIRLLQRYAINVNVPIFDLQKDLQSNYKKLYSLDLLIDILSLKIDIEKGIFASTYKYELPNKSGKTFKYNTKHLEAHHASGDCIFLFLAAKELGYFYLD